MKNDESRLRFWCEQYAKALGMDLGQPIEPGQVLGAIRARNDRSTDLAREMKDALVLIAEACDSPISEEMQQEWSFNPRYYESEVRRMRDALDGVRNQLKELGAPTHDIHSIPRALNKVVWALVIKRIESPDLERDQGEG